MIPPSVIVSTNTITDPNIANSNRQFIQLAPRVRDWKIIEDTRALDANNRALFTGQFFHDYFVNCEKVLKTLKGII